MGYPTTDELVPASAVDELKALEAEQQDGLRASAIEAVEAFCRQSFEFEGTEGDPIELTVRGAGTDELRLERRLATPVSVTVDGQALVPDDYTLNTSPNGSTIRLVSPIGGSWLTRVRRVPGDPGPNFADGATVVVAGVLGWTDAEWEAGDLDAIAAAIRFDMEDQAQAEAHKLSATVRSARALGLADVSQGNLALTLRPGEPGLSVRAQRKLFRYRWTGPVGALA